MMRIQLMVLTILVYQSAFPQTYREPIAEEFVFEKPSDDNALIIANINGSVRVTAYEGSKIQVQVAKVIDAKTEARLETGKQEVQLAVMDRADTLILYVRDGCHDFQRHGSRDRGGNLGGWHYQSPDNKSCDPGYDFKMDFDVRVPAGVNLLVSTINTGDVRIEGVNGSVKAFNINGAIRLTSLRNNAYAHTINGDVEVAYAANPSGTCRFYTLNGNINARFQPGLSADLSFESFNGAFYTNLEKIQTLPAQIEKADGGEGLRYRISGNQYRVRNGGPMIDFETFNGNVYLEEQ